MIGGTGTISSAITRQLAAAGHDLWLLNRGTRKVTTQHPLFKCTCCEYYGKIFVNKS